MTGGSAFCQDPEKKLSNTFEIQTGLSYKWSVSRDFSQEKLIAKFLETNFCFCLPLASLPVTAGYFFRLPVANAGTRDFGLKKAIRYDHSLGVNALMPENTWPVRPYLHVSYLFYGYTEMNAFAKLTGTTLSGDIITTPESTIDVNFTTRGFSFGTGIQKVLTGGRIIYGSWVRTLEKVNLKRLDINGIDQKYLGAGTIDGAIENSNSFAFGTIWHF